MASFFTVPHLHFHVSREFARKSLGHLCLGMVGATGDVRGADMSVNMIVVKVWALLLVVCFLVLICGNV